MISPGTTTQSKRRPGPVFLSHAAISERIAELADSIDRDHADRDLVLVPVLKGAAVFAADLSRALRVRHELSCVALDGYVAARPSGYPAIRLLLDVGVTVKSRGIVIVEDLVDTGMTLNYLITTLGLYRPRSIRVCTLLDRAHRRLLADLPLHYVGFSVPDEDFVAYGMGRPRHLRHLPDLHRVAGGSA